jgi:hypothetical protein
MKILAKFLLSSVFVFLPAVCCSQDDFRLDKDCGFAPALKVYTTDPNGRVSPQIVEMLEDGQNCLNDNLIGLKTSVEKLHTEMGWNAHSNLGIRDDIKDLDEKLEQTELKLHTAETKIETLEDRLRTAEEALQLLQQRAWMPPRPASSPKATASQPKAPVNKPTPAAKESTH